MAKEFKLWDKQFTKAEIATERASLGNLLSLDRWGYRIEVWAIADVRFAVYEAGSARDWQRFRVALKGLDTIHKLGALERRLQKALRMELEAARRLEFIRIDNYIGAIRRGGQLDENFRVVK